MNQQEVKDATSVCLHPLLVQAAVVVPPVLPEAVLPRLRKQDHPIIAVLQIEVPPDLQELEIIAEEDHQTPGEENEVFGIYSDINAFIGIIFIRMLFLLFRNLPE